MKHSSSTCAWHCICRLDCLKEKSQSWFFSKMHFSYFLLFSTCWIIIIIGPVHMKPCLQRFMNVWRTRRTLLCIHFGAYLPLSLVRFLNWFYRYEWIMYQIKAFLEQTKRRLKICLQKSFRPVFTTGGLYIFNCRS